MNDSTAIFLISDKVRAIHVTYEDGDDAPIALCKTLDSSIKVDDFVVVSTDTRHKMTVCKVVGADVDIDVETTEEIKWIVGVVYTANFEDIKRQEDEAVIVIKNAERRRKRKELSEAMGIDDTDGVLTALPIYTVGAGDTGEDDNEPF